MFLSQPVIHSATLFKQSVSLSKHVNPPTSSLFQWTLAATGAHTHTHAHGSVSGISEHHQTNTPFLHIQVGGVSDSTAGTDVGKEKRAASPSWKQKINKSVGRRPRSVLLFHAFMCSPNRREKKKRCVMVYTVSCT